MDEVVVCSEGPDVDVCQRNADIEKGVLDRVDRIEQDLNTAICKDSSRRLVDAALVEKQEDESEQREEDSEVLEVLKMAKGELEQVEEEAEERFRLNKIYSSIDEITRSSQIVGLVKSMQRFVDGVLKSGKFKEEIGGLSKIDDVSLVGSNIEHAIRKIDEIDTEKSKLKDIQDLNFDFEIVIETKDLESKFVNEFCDIEESITKLETKIGILDSFKLPTIKQIIFYIMKDISKIKISENEKLKENILLLQKELKTLNLALLKNEIENKDSSSNEESKEKESNSSDPKLLSSKLDITAKIQYKKLKISYANYTPFAYLV